jgi:hypothetical protein
MANDEKKDKAAQDEASKGLLTDAIKKVFATGVSAAFMTEESVRAYLADLKLPKEVLNVILQQAGKSKEELVARVGKEISGILNKINVVEELSKFAETHKFKITAEIEVTKKQANKDS